MSTAVNKEPTYYNSLYRHGVDEKRRVQIPAKWRPEKPGTELTLMLWPKAKEGPCLRVLPPAEMAKMVKAIDAMSNGDPNKVVLKRLIGSGSVQVSVDKAGRICLPEEASSTDARQFRIAPTNTFICHNSVWHKIHSSRRTRRNQRNRKRKPLDRKSTRLNSSH